VQGVKVDLADGAWAEIRDKLKGKDKAAVHRALEFEVSDNSVRKASAELMTIMTTALLTQVITSWSYPEPIPSESADPREVLEELDLDDYNTLEEAVKPLLDKVMKFPNRATPSA
jgi:hypothetical protein